MKWQLDEIGVPKALTFETRESEIEKTGTESFLSVGRPIKNTLLARTLLFYHD